MRDQRTADILAVVIENAELRAQLAEVQDQCVELAVDAGELHAEIEALRGRLARAERERDAWKPNGAGAQAEIAEDYGGTTPAPAWPQSAGAAAHRGATQTQATASHTSAPRRSGAALASEPAAKATPWDICPGSISATVADLP